MHPQGPPLPYLHEFVGALRERLQSVVIDQEELTNAVLIAVLAGGHVLVEGPPGTGKTLLARTLAKLFGGTSRRIQGTPDLLPAEVTGSYMWHRSTEDWHFQEGPVFANVLVVDEMNRISPRTQSALLESMAERQVTVDGRTSALPEPFVTIATQNPPNDPGVFPLLPPQLDRFIVGVEMERISMFGERSILEGSGGFPGLEALQPAGSPTDLLSATTSCRKIEVSSQLLDYLQAVTEAVRVQGAPLSTRSIQGAMQCSQAHALLSGRDFVVPDDVLHVVPMVYGHRCGSGTSIAAGRELVESAAQSVAVPRS